MINIDGENFYNIDDVFDGYFFGNKVYMVSKDGELIYVDKDGIFKKLLNDLKIIIIFINLNLNLWCVYCFLIIGDLLVGVFESRIGFVICYNYVG